MHLFDKRLVGRDVEQVTAEIPFCLQTLFERRKIGDADSGFTRADW